MLNYTWKWCIMILNKLPINSMDTWCISSYIILHMKMHTSRLCHTYPPSMQQLHLPITVRQTLYTSMISKWCREISIYAIKTNNLGDKECHINCKHNIFNKQLIILDLISQLGKDYITQQFNILVDKIIIYLYRPI